jgi:PAS domain S-box-containing protein
VVSGRDGSGEWLGERGAERVARVYTMLSMAYEAIVRVRERLPLFDQVCRVLVEQGRLRMAWVGEVDDHGWIVPVAHAGVTDGYLDDIRISVRDVAEGRGPTGTSARKRQHVFVGDIVMDERMAPWREAALARGYRSSAAFPLVVDDHCVAVLTSYASEPGFFDEHQVELFDRMAADLSFALEAMQREERRQALEAELRSSEERFRVATESMLDAFTILSPVRDDDGEITDFRYRYVNEAYCELVGLDRGRLLGHRVGELFPQFPDGERFELYRRVALTGEPCRTDDVQLPSTWAGTALDSRVLDTVIASMGEGLVVSARDITDRKQAEQEREQALAELQEVQQIARLGSWHRDPASGTRTWSAGMYAVYGRDPGGGPMDADETLTWVHPDDLQRVQKAYANMRSGGQRFELDYRLLTGDRGMRTVHAIARPDPERPGSYRGTLQDVTALREAEADAALAAIVDSSDDAIIGKTLDGQITSWNPAAEEIYGYRAAEAVGNHISMLLAPGQEDDLTELLARLARGERVSHVETTRRRKDGGIIDVSITTSPIRDRQGRIAGAATVARDVTVRKQHKRELQRLAQAAEYGTDAILSIGLDGRVRHWNHGAERLYGYSAEEAIGHDLRDLTLLDSIDKHIERVRGGASPYQYEGQRRRKDGTVIDILTNVVPWHVDGQLVGVTGVTIDMTERKRAEQTAARLAAIVESTDDAIVTYSPEGVIETWNAGAERLSGYSAQEAIGQPRGMAAAEGRKQEPFEDALAGRTTRYESRVKRRDGVVIDIGLTLSPIREADGAIVGVSCIWHDITERKQIERALREHQATLEAALSSMTDAVFISDAQGRFVVFNEAFTTFHRFTSREQTLRSLEDYPAILEVFMTNGEPAPLEQWAASRALRGELGTNVEYGLQRKDTGERWVGSYSFAPIRSADGTIVGSVVTGRDITAWKNAQAELEQAQRLARLGSWTWDPGANQVTWSAQMYELFGRDQALGPAIGDALLRYVHPEDRQRVAERYELGAESESEFELDFRIIIEQGEERVLHAVGREDPSRPGRYRGTFQDVTDQRRSEAERSELLQAAARAEEARRLNVELEQRVAARTFELERANRELETFAYSVSHDLRAPLRAVDGFSTALLEDYGDQLDEGGRHDLERVRAGAVRMGNLIDEILQLSRLSRRHFERVPVDISALASEIATGLNDAEPDRRVEVQIEPGLLAQADLELVRNLLQNLLGNAYKFTSKTRNPAIRFGAVEQNGVPVYIVADNGAGFDMAHAEQLFRPFHRLHRATEFPGDGIGLATVVRAVHRHGGVIWADGAVNQGATFHFSLTPGAQPPASAATGEDVIPTWQPADPDGTDDHGRAPGAAD